MTIFYLATVSIVLAFMLGLAVGATLVSWVKEAQIGHLRDNAMRHRLAAENLAEAVDSLEKKAKDAEEHARLLKEFTLEAKEAQRKAEAEVKSLREFTVELG